jgi:hypothetical protein
MIDGMKIKFHCARQTSPDCHRWFDVDESELTGGQPPEGMTDHGFLPQVPVPEDWLMPDDATSDDEFVCSECATPKEIERHMAALASLEREHEDDDDS